MTLQKLFETAWRQHWDTPRFRKSGWAKEVESYWRLHIGPAFGEKEVSSITIKDIREWHRELSARTLTTANRCLEVLSKLFTFGEEQELVGMGKNPCRLVRANTERKRHRYASEKEITAIGAKLLKELPAYPRETAFVYLLALTGARPRSLARAKRSELSREATYGVLRFQGKTSQESGEEEMVIIPGEAMKTIVDKLPLRTDGLLIGEVYYRNFWRRIRRDAGCPDLWLRDLRRTFATIGLSNNLSLDKIGELLNHKSQQTTKNYAKLHIASRLNAANTISNRVGTLMKGQK